GDTWGYPLSLEGSAPSLFNVTAQSPLFNPALHDFIQAARSENRAMAEENKDRKNQVTQDTVLTYLELLKWQKQIAPLRQQYEDALKTQELVDQRVKAGVDSEQAGKQSQLVAARAYLRITQAQGAIDLLRASLSQLRGSLRIHCKLIPILYLRFPRCSRKTTTLKEPNKQIRQFCLLSSMPLR